MAAPAHTTLVMPTGIKIPDGFRTTVAFARKSPVNLWWKDVKPPGMDGGGPIDTTTMLNNVVRTKEAKQLKTLLGITANAAYDPSVLSDMYNLVNRNGSITCWLPDGSYCDFYGYLDKFVPGDNKEGEMPLAACTIEVTNWDPISRIEVEPVFGSVTGT